MNFEKYKIIELDSSSRKNLGNYSRAEGFHQCQPNPSPGPHPVCGSCPLNTCRILKIKFK